MPTLAALPLFLVPLLGELLFGELLLWMSKIDKGCCFDRIKQGKQFIMDCTWE